MNAMVALIQRKTPVLPAPAQDATEPAQRFGNAFAANFSPDRQTNGGIRAYGLLCTPAIKRTPSNA